jgi:hypothetical protein
MLISGLLLEDVKHQLICAIVCSVPNVEVIRRISLGGLGCLFMSAFAHKQTSAKGA